MHRKFLLVTLSFSLSIITCNVYSQPIQVHKLLGLMPALLPKTNALVSFNNYDLDDLRKQSISKKYFSVYSSSLDSLAKVLRKDLLNYNSIQLARTKTTAQDAIQALLDEVGGYDKLKKALDDVEDIEQQNFIKNYMVSKGFLPVIIGLQSDTKTVINSGLSYPIKDFVFKNYIHRIQELRNCFLPEIENSIKAGLLNIEKFEAYKEGLMKIAVEMDETVRSNLKGHFNHEIILHLTLTELEFIDSFKELTEIAGKLKYNF